MFHAKPIKWATLGPQDVYSFVNGTYLYIILITHKIIFYIKGGGDNNKA